MIVHAMWTLDGRTEIHQKGWWSCFNVSLILEKCLEVNNLVTPQRAYKN